MSVKREKELARAKWERQQARRLEKAQRNSVTKRAFLAFVVIAAIVTFIIKQQPSSTEIASPDSSQTSSITTSPTASVAGCHSVAGLQTKPKQFPTPPAGGLPGKKIQLTTNCGQIEFEIDARAPKTATIMSNLARSAYFTRTACHRLTTSGIYVLQCGDPTATGTGGPGFSFADENLPTTSNGAPYTYPRGTVAMANSGANTNGSQFFLVYKDSPLPPNYSVWGKITTGLSVLDRISAAGVSGGGTDGKPNANVVIERAFVR